MVKVMGIDHVGIGLDLDGGGGVLGMNDVSEMPNITKELIARGYTEPNHSNFYFKVLSAIKPFLNKSPGPFHLKSILYAIKTR